MAERAVMHPALRWVSDESARAHRRTRAGGTLCGVAGPLRLADPGVDLCPTCYPRTGT